MIMIRQPENFIETEKGVQRQFAHPYPDGYKSYSRSKPLTIAEFDLEKAWWGGAEGKGRKVTEQSWKVSAKELAEHNYNLDCKNPHEVEVNHRDPEELMVEYQQIVHQLEAAQAALKSELMACLGGEGMSRKKKTGKEVSIVRSSAAEYLTFVAAISEITGRLTVLTDQARV